MMAHGDAKGFPDISADLRQFARNLRRDQTDGEQRVWSLLRDRRMAGMKFRRQHPVPPYVLDFYCDEARLAIELDGGQHAEQVRRDAMRSEFLAAQGIKVLRFWNNEVLSQPEAVAEAIWNAVAPSPPAPLPEGEGSCCSPSPSGRRVGMRAPLTPEQIADDALAPDPPPRGRGEKK